ncbi:MAG: polysaccharide deacetylase family protein [Oscillospiraceae bacterium]|nr:polysaccharide deacetylase family protein [Oscillospiraceae bacterium]
MTAVKKILSLLLCGAISVLSACGGDSGNAAETVSVTEQSIEETKPETEEVTTEVTTVTRPERPELTKDMKLIALTFDDGPNITTTNAVIDKLEKYEIVASFFVIGDNITGSATEGSGRVMKRAYDLGCEIHNHSKTHSDMTKMTAEDIIAELEYTSDKVEEITGEPTSFFRPPYIAVNDTMFESTEMPFIAGVGANDWMDTVSAEDRAQKILEQSRDGGIILLHDAQGNSKTVDALDIIIPSLLDEGYTFVTMSELFEAKEITPADGIIYSNTDQTTMYGS